MQSIIARQWSRENHDKRNSMVDCEKIRGVPPTPARALTITLRDSVQCGDDVMGTELHKAGKHLLI